MKTGSSIKNKIRDKNCKVVKRGKSLVVINKVNPKFKFKQGKKKKS